MNMMNPTWSSYWQTLSRQPTTDLIFCTLVSENSPPPQSTDLFFFFTLLSSLFTQDSLPVATQQGCCMSIMNNRKSLVFFYTCITTHTSWSIQYQILISTAALQILSGLQVIYYLFVALSFSPLSLGDPKNANG